MCLCLANEVAVKKTATINSVFEKNSLLLTSLLFSC